MAGPASAKQPNASASQPNALCVSAVGVTKDDAEVVHCLQLIQTKLDLQPIQTKPFGTDSN
jgi:hypothetical protein